MNDQFYKIFLLQGLARVSASVGHATIIWGNKHTQCHLDSILKVYVKDCMF